MFVIFPRFILVVTLVLLQCIAPLVHAHTHETLASNGVHLPELERYAKTPDPQPICQAANCHDDGFVVGVNTGVQRDALLPIQIKKYLLDLPLILVKPVVVLKPEAGFSLNLVFSFPVLNHSFDDFFYAPRAPPVLV